MTPLHQLRPLWTGACAAAALLATTACSRMPSPLTPTLHGSVGLPYQGVLAGGVELPPQGPGYKIIKPPGRNFGTPSLVSTIEYAAAEVARQRPGPPLHVGDLSARNGGQITNHRSHRSGRDADLLYYVTTVSGAPIESLGFVPFGSDSLAQAQAGPQRIYIRFDLERNWLLVKSLVTAPSSEMLWIFVARPIEALITEYALLAGRGRGRLRGRRPALALAR
jgi:penicillin-insensitive murein endopeptidase